MIKPLQDPIWGSRCPQSAKNGKTIDTVLKPYYVEKSMDIMPFDAPNFENMKFPHY